MKIENQFELTKHLTKLQPRKCGIKDSHKLLALQLADFTKQVNGSFSCYPSMDTLALLCGWSKKTTMDRMRELRQTGLVESKQQYGNLPNIYTFNLQVLEKMLVADCIVKEERRGDVSRFQEDNFEELPF